MNAAGVGGGGGGPEEDRRSGAETNLGESKKSRKSNGLEVTGHPKTSCAHN